MGFARSAGDFADASCGPVRCRLAAFSEVVFTNRLTRRGAPASGDSGAPGAIIRRSVSASFTLTP
jgi:hypothetical protein